MRPLRTTPKQGWLEKIQNVTRLDLSFCAAEEGHILFPGTTDDSSQPLVDFFSLSHLLAKINSSQILDCLGKF